MDIPECFRRTGVVYTVTAYSLVEDPDLTGLVLTDCDDEPVAYQVFDSRSLDDAPNAGGAVGRWLHAVVDDLLNSDGRDTCDDCGNRNGVPVPEACLCPRY